MAAVAHPSVIWAQRKNCIFLTICLDDCEGPEIRVEDGSVFFKGKGGAEQKVHEAQIDFFASIDPAASVHLVRPRNVEFCLKKKEENFWPRLTKNSAKLPWLKVDFDKWKDEDDSGDEMGGGGPGGMGGPGGDTDFEEMMRQMGGLGGGAGMGGMGGKPDLSDLGNHETDSDDDEALPDLE